MRLFDIEPDATGDHVITADQDGTHILVALDVRVGRGVLHLGNGVHRLTPFGFLGVIDDQIDGLALAWDGGRAAIPGPSGGGPPRAPTARPRRSC